MATVTRSTRRSPAYLPTPAEIEAAKAELDAKRLAAFDAANDAKPSECERLEKERIRQRRIRAEAKLAQTNLKLQQSDQTEPLDLDEHRDPRQTEQWLPAAAEPEEHKMERSLFLPFGSPEWKKARIQEKWDMRRELRALEKDANARGVLNYYNVNGGMRMPYQDRGWDGFHDMQPEDIANVQFLQMGELDDALGMLIDAVESQHEMEDLNCRWKIVDPTPQAPKAAEPAVIPFKTVLKPKRFRSSV